MHTRATVVLIILTSTMTLSTAFAQTSKKPAAPAQRACPSGCWKGTITIDGRTYPREGSAVISDLEDEDGRHISIELNKSWLKDATEGVDPDIWIRRNDERMLPAAGAHALANACSGKVMSNDIEVDVTPVHPSLHGTVDGRTHKGELTLTLVSKARVTGTVRLEGCAAIYDADGHLIKSNAPISAEATFDARPRR